MSKILSFLLKGAISMMFRLLRMLRKLGITASLCIVSLLQTITTWIFDPPYISLIVVSLLLQAYLYNTLGKSKALDTNSFMFETRKIPTLIEISSNQQNKSPTNKAKRVLIATMEAIGPSKGGGIATAYTAMSEALATAGHEVTVLYTERYNLGEWDDWVASYRAKGIRMVRLWDYPFQDVVVGVGCSTHACVRSHKTYQWLRNRTGKRAGGNWYDIVHFHDNGGIGFFSELAKHHGEDGFEDMVFIAGAHGPHLWERLANEFMLEDHRHLEVDHMERKMAQYSDVVVSPSAYMVQWMYGMKWNLPHHTYVHQNILPKPVFQAELEMKANSLNDTGTMDEVVFFGRLERRKGLFTFLNALALIVSNYTSPLPPPYTTNSTNPTVNGTTTLNIARPNVLSGIKVSFLGRSTLVDAGTMAHQLIARWCFNLMITCEVKPDMSQQEAVLFAVIASPVDNSPNTVLECLSYGIKFIASNTGGIPELVHQDDRERVLFDPYPDNLARLLESFLVKRVPLRKVTAAVANELRQSLWVDLHSTLIPDLFTPAKSDTVIKRKTPKVTICAQLWCTSNFSVLLQSIVMQDFPHVGVVLGVHSRCHEHLLKIVESQFSSSKIVVIPVAEEVEEELLLQAWHVLSQIDVTNTDFFLFIDPSSWLLQTYSISRLVGIATKTSAAVVNSAYVDTTKNSSVVAFTGCSGGHGVTYNCFGGWINATVYRDLAPVLERGANEWRFYSRVNSYGHAIESATEPHFTMTKLDPPVARSTSLANLVSQLIPVLICSVNLTAKVSPSASVGKQKVVRDYSRILPAEFEPFVTVASHCLMTSSSEPPSAEVLTQHIELVFVRGYINSGVGLGQYLTKSLMGVHMVTGPANFHIISSALRSFVTAPSAGSAELYTLHTKKWFLTFVRSFLLAEIPLENSNSFSWAGEAAAETIHPVFPGAAYMLMTRDGRNVVVSYYYQNLWCHKRRDLEQFKSKCHSHSDVSLFDPLDLQQYELDDTYYSRNPNRLFAVEQPFRAVSRAWADRIKEDEEAIARIATRDIDARLLEIEYHTMHNTRNSTFDSQNSYEQVLHFPKQTRDGIIKFLALDEAQQIELEEPLSDTTLGEMDGEWETIIQSTTPSKYLWKVYFTQNTTEWFKQEAGDTLLKKKYEKDSDWQGNT